MNMFAIHHLSCIKKSIGTKLAEWLQMTGREIFIERSNTPIIELFHWAWFTFLHQNRKQTKICTTIWYYDHVSKNFSFRRTEIPNFIYEKRHNEYLHIIGNSANSFLLSNCFFMANSFEYSHKRRLYQIYSRIPIESNQNKESAHIKQFW